MHRCDLKGNGERMAWYQAKIKKISPEILALQLSQPALRALVDLEVFTLADLKQLDGLTLRKSHGIGPNALRKLETLH